METSQLPKMLKKLHLYTLLLCALISFGSYAQTYPISISTQLSQPSPIYLSNYADATTINSPIKIQLVLNDLTISNRQVRLKIYFQGNGISFSTNDFVVGSRPLYLEGGFPLQLTNVDLAPYFEYQNLSGLNPNQYAQPLPEGIYNIYVEVYDFATGKKLSNKTGSTTIIFQNDPPFLNLPLHNASIMQQNIQNIIFSWTPRSINISNVEYEFSLVEIWDKYTPIQNAFAYSPPLYTATTRTTTLQYGINEPQLIPGKKYAWRIKAKAILGAEEIGVFKNNGYSEIFSFDYEIFCTAPLAIKTSGVSENQAKIEWSGNIDNYDYQVNYREKNANSEWYKQVTPRENITLSNLKPNTNYEYTVGSSCDVGKYTHSTVKEFTTIARDEIAFASCGIKPDPNDLTNTTPLPELFPNDVVSAGDFPIVVIKATGSNGTFSGEGYVTFPFLEKFRKLIDATDNLQGIANKGAEIVGKVSTAANASANLASNAADKVSSRLDNPTANSISNSTENAQGKVADIGAKVNEKAGDIAADIGKYETNIGEYTRVRITFNNIGINTDFKLISGEIIASYDPEWKGIADLDKVFDKVFGSDGIPIEGKFDYEVIDVKLNADGSTTIIGKDGQTSTIAKSPYERVYTDSTGKVITIPANGAGAPNITTGATGGKATAANTNGMSANGEVIQISSADVKITFKNGDDSKYAFDVKPDFASQKLLATYETIPMKDGGVYNVDYKAVSDIYDAKKFPETIIAKAEFKNGKTKDDIVFKTNAGAQVKFEWKNDNTAIITVEKTLNFSKESIIATVKGAKEKDPKDATKTIEGKSEIAGKINLWQLAQKPVINITLLSVNGANTPDIDDAKEFLNNVYNKVGIKFEVTTASVKIEPLPDVIQCGDSDIFNFYSDGQKKIIGGIESSSEFEYNDKTYYVIYTGKSGEKNYKGFMPLGGQYAFVFKNGNLKTAAHELGHGIFGLKHPFSNISEAEKTDLLMDYKEGTVLSHNDWDIIHSGGWKFYGFQKSPSGAHTGGGLGITPSNKVIVAYPSSYDNMAATDIVSFMVSSFKTTNDYAVTGYAIYDDTKTLKARYKWEPDDKNANGGSYKSEGKTFNVTLKDEGPAYIYKLLENCFVWYKRVEWKKGNTLANYKTADSEFSRDKTFNFDAACLDKLNKNIKDTYAKCDLPKEEEGFKKITEIVTDSKNLIDKNLVVTTINSVCLSSLRRFKDSEKQQLFDRITIGSLDNETEIAALKLMSSMYTTQYSDFIKTLQAKNNEKLSHLIEEIDDKLFFMYGDNNYTDFTNAIAEMVKSLSDEVKWNYINLLINKRYSKLDIREQTAIATVLSNLTQDKLENLNEASFLIEMLKFSPNLINLLDYKNVYLLAKARSKNETIFNQFTQTIKRVEKTTQSFPDVIFITLEVNGDPDWFSPRSMVRNKQVNTKLVETFTFSQKDLAVEFGWVEFLYSKEGENTLKSLASNRPEDLKAALVKFNEQLLIYTTKKVVDDKNYWDAINTVTCDNITDILNHIRLKESSTSLKNVKYSTRLNIIENIILCQARETVNVENTEDALFKVLRSFDASDNKILTELEKIGFNTIYENFSGMRLKKFCFWAASQITSSGHFSTSQSEKLFIKNNELISDYSKLIQLEQNVTEFNNTSFDKKSKTTFNVTGFGEFRYNEMVPVYIAGSFQYLNEEFEKGTVAYMPLIQFIAMSNDNTNLVFEKSAWVALDGIFLVIGVGELKYVYTVGNNIHKAIAILEIAGNATSATAQLLNNDTISEEFRFNLQMASLAMNIPSLIGKMPKAEIQAEKLLAKLEKEATSVNEKISYSDYIRNLFKLKQPTTLLEKLKKLPILEGQVNKLEGLKARFMEDFANASDDVLKEMNKADSELFSGWKNFRKNYVDEVLCN